jgi:two-component system, OmpR family, phosphate regulon sensor histidine kinase PhoR
MVRDVPDVCVQRRTTPGNDTEAPRLLPSSEHLRLETALAGSFELVAGIALFALAATALVVVLVPRSAATRLEFAVELVFVGVALVVLALLLSRRSARAVMRPLEVLDVALAAVTRGDFTVHVELERAAAEIQAVGESVNALVRELARLRVIEIERTKDQRVRRELSEVVHASLDLDYVVQRAVEVVGPALDVDRVHIRLRDGDGNGGGDQGWLAAEWRRSDDVASVLPLSAAVEPDPLIALIGVTDDRRAVVIDDAIDEARFDVEQRKALEALGVRASLTYPLFVGTRVAGVLVASEQRAPRSWSDGEVMLTEGFAFEIGRALDHALAFKLRDEMVERMGVLDRAKNEFLSEVSRELRGPLASVVGYIELLTDESAESVSAEQRRMLRIVERSGERLLVVIDNLLTMSRIEAGTFDPKLGPIDLGVVVRRVCDAVSTTAAKDSLELDVNLEQDLDLIADEKQIERALHNLVSNAMKFTPGGGHIDLSARTEGGEVVIDVRDTGVGIPAEQQDELFTRFFTARAAPRRGTLGAGLGLYIVKQIVDAHDGSVGAVSVQGRGSTFTMRLPARPNPEDRGES